MKSFKITISWMLVAAVMIMIFCLSSQAAAESGKLSEGFISKFYGFFLDFFAIPCSVAEFESTVSTLQYIVRKLAHFCIYMALGFLFANAYFQTGLKNYKKNIFIALLSSAIYAATDEFHQLFVKGRSGEINDVFIDTCGALTGILIFNLLCVLWRKIWTSRKH